jgi:hypothetical protein
MHLSEILEKYTIDEISKRTNITEHSLDMLLKGEFCYLKKVQCMGFLSILEREYKADLGALRDSAKAFYASNDEDCHVTMGMPIDQPKTERSKLPIILIIIMLLVGASWYFINKFDKEKFKSMLPFNESSSSIFSVDETTPSELSIENINIDKNGTK